MYSFKMALIGTILFVSGQAFATSTQEQDAQLKQIADLGDQIAVAMDNCVASRRNSSTSCKQMVALDKQVADIRKRMKLTDKQSLALMERNPLVFQRIFRTTRIMCEKHAQHLPSNLCPR